LSASYNHHVWDSILGRFRKGTPRFFGLLAAAMPDRDIKVGGAFSVVFALYAPPCGQSHPMLLCDLA
jgi:hypothetical protein